MRKCFFIFLFAFISLQMSAQVKFGYLSYDSLLYSMPEYIKAQQDLAALKKTYDAEMKRSEDNFNQQFMEFIDGQNSFPENILLKRQKELQQLMEESLKFKEEAQRLLSKAEEELMAPIRKKLNDAINKVGLECGYAFVMNTDSNAYPFISADMGVGIADKVKAVLEGKPTPITE